MIYGRGYALPKLDIRTCLCWRSFQYLPGDYSLESTQTIDEVHKRQTDIKCYCQQTDANWHQPMEAN
eukprot:c8504_g1_i1 orf=1-198(-)